MINKKEPPRYNGKRDSRTGEVLPPINFERDTGWPASQYKEWLAATEMSPIQQEMLRDVIREYVENSETWPKRDFSHKALLAAK